MSFPGKYQRVIVASASGRWLAQSALVAQHPVSVIDLFADQDTVDICKQSNAYLVSDQSLNTVTRCDSMIAVWESLLRKLESEPPETKIILGGGMENVPPSLQSLCKAYTHRFHNMEAFQKIQCVDRFKKFCQLFEILMPEIITGKSTIKDFLRAARFPSKHRWLSKTSASAGGLGVQIADEEMVVTDDMYLQRFVEGRSIGGTFITVRSTSEPSRPETRLLGVCEAWPRAGAADSASRDKLSFRYTGSFGPISKSPDLSQTVREEMERIGKAAANYFRLSGVFGIDFIVAEGQLWILEINPRIPASAEILEKSFIAMTPQISSACSIAQLHLAALDGRDFLLPTIGKHTFAKEILYMDRAWPALTFDAALLKELQTIMPPTAAEEDCSDVAYLTDLPTLETVVAPAAPIMTLHVSASDVKQLEISMTHYRDQLLRVLARV